MRAVCACVRVCVVCVCASCSYDASEYGVSVGNWLDAMGAIIE